VVDCEETKHERECKAGCKVMSTAAGSHVGGTCPWVSYHVYVNSCYVGKLPAPFCDERQREAILLETRIQ